VLHQPHFAKAARTEQFDEAPLRRVRHGLAHLEARSTPGQQVYQLKWIAQVQRPRDRGASGVLRPPQRLSRHTGNLRQNGFELNDFCLGPAGRDFARNLLGVVSDLLGVGLDDFLNVGHHLLITAGVAIALERLAKLIKSSDAVIVVAGEYNHSIQPALSNLLDHFLEEWYWRPAAIACYSAGQFGGVRAAMQLRALLPEIGMPSIPSILAMPRAQDLFDEQGQPRPDWVARQAGRFLDELEWYANALKAARAGGVPY